MGPLLEMEAGHDAVVLATLNGIDILIGQVYCKLKLLLGLKKGRLEGLFSGNDSSVQN